MKKFLTAALVSISLIAATFMVVGCDSSSISNAQLKVIATQAGMFSAVGWIAIDNPTTEQIAAVGEVIAVIKAKADAVSTGVTYSVAVYPEVATIIDAQVNSTYKPICKAAAISLLGGLDLLFAQHPEWKNDQTKVLVVVDSFLIGATSGLALTESTPVITQARANFKARAAVQAAK